MIEKAILLVSALVRFKPAYLYYEAFRCRNFQSFTIADVDDSLVESVNKNNGRCTIHIAFPDKILSRAIERIRMLNIKKSKDRKEIIKAVSEADEIATSLLSVTF